MWWGLCQTIQFWRAREKQRFLMAARRRGASKLTLKTRRKKSIDLHKAEKSSTGSPLSAKRGTSTKKVGRGRPKKSVSPSREPKSSPKIVRKSPIKVRSAPEDHNLFHVETPKKTKQPRQVKKGLKPAPKPLKSRAKSVVKSPASKVHKKSTPKRRSRLSLPRRKKSTRNRTSALTH